MDECRAEHGKPVGPHDRHKRRGLCAICFLCWNNHILDNRLVVNGEKDAEQFEAWLKGRRERLRAGGQ